MENTISEERLYRYFKITTEAYNLAKEHVIPGKEKEAKEIFDMVSNYLSDARHFEKKGDWVNAFAALNYAHGWLDAGVRLDIIDVKEDRLFTVKE